MTLNTNRRKSVQFHIDSTHYPDSLLGQTKNEELEPTLASSSSTSSFTVLSSTTPLSRPRFYIQNNSCNYKKLGNYLSKFQNKVKQRTNIIRWHLLPWLESNTAKIEMMAEYTKQTKGWVLKNKEKKLQNGKLMLLRWWRALLNNMFIVNNEEKCLYFECILAIMSRSEFTDYDDDLWNEKCSNKFVLCYRQLLKSTLNSVIHKLNQRAIFSNMISLCAKILALCFFKIPGLAAILLSQLTVKTILFTRIWKEMESHLPAYSAQEKNYLKSVFPSFLHPIMTSNIFAYREYMNMSSHQLNFPDATQHATANWVKRWQSDDSGLFFAFYQHYHYLLSTYTSIVYPVIKHQRLYQRNSILTLLPGYMYLASFFAGKIDSLVHRRVISVTNTAHQPIYNRLTIDLDPNCLKNSDTLNLNNEALAAFLDAFNVDQGSTTARYNQSLGKPVQLDNATKKYAACIIRCALIESNQTALFYDMINIWIRSAIRKTVLTEVEQVYCLFDFMEQIILQLEKYPFKHKEALPIDIPYILHTLDIVLSKSDHSLSLLRALSFIYTNFEFLTSQVALTEFLCLDVLLNTNIFERLLLHWSKNVRFFYSRCLIWRVGRVYNTKAFNWHNEDTTPRSSMSICDSSFCTREWYKLIQEKKQAKEGIHLRQCSLKIHIVLETLMDAFYKQYDHVKRMKATFSNARQIYNTCSLLACKDIKPFSSQTVVLETTNKIHNQASPKEKDYQQAPSSCYKKIKKFSDYQFAETYSKCFMPVKIFKSKNSMHQNHVEGISILDEIYTMPSRFDFSIESTNTQDQLEVKEYRDWKYHPSKHVYASKAVDELEGVSKHYHAWLEKLETSKTRCVPQLFLNWPKHWTLNPA